MPSLADLVRMGKQYVSDVLPGGSLNQEVNRQGILDGAALSTTAVPVLGDLLGLGADLNRYATDPESRTAGNFALSGLGMLPFVPAMTAWHGSPHKFDKFSLDKIGTGEGAQAYGHGIYLAESPSVAESYAGMLAPNPRLAKNGEYLNAKSYSEMLAESRAAGAGKIDKAIQRTQRTLQDLPQNGRGMGVLEDVGSSVNGAGNGFDIKQERDILASLLKLKRKGYEVKQGGEIYKTDIPDEVVARFLDWDKPLSQQAPEVQKAVKAISPKNRSGQPMVNLDAMGSEMIGALGGGDGASALLRQQGIPGIRYLDGGSRSAGQGSSNFVAFDPEMIRILERNGQATGLEPWKPGEYRLKDLITK